MKFIFMLLLALLISVPAVASSVACDFNGDSVINNDDLMILFAFIQVRTDIFTDLNKENVQSRARVLTNNPGLVVERLPEVSDIIVDPAGTQLTNADLMTLLAFIQVRASRTDLTLENVQNRARVLTGNSGLTLYKMPGTAP